MYRILWHNKLTGGGDVSPILYTSLEQATEIAIKADKDYPDILHLVRYEKRRNETLELA